MVVIGSNWRTKESAASSHSSPIAAEHLHLMIGHDLPVSRAAIKVLRPAGDSNVGSLLSLEKDAWRVDRREGCPEAGGRCHRGPTCEEKDGSEREEGHPSLDRTQALTNSPTLPTLVCDNHDALER
jgi:hypothetical protein